MESIRQLYKIGHGPSSSHTMGPQMAANIFAERTRGKAERFRVTLYGSLAATGRGHLTDQAILNALTPVATTEIVWQPDIVLPFHTNGMKFDALDMHGNIVDTWTVYSIGGGDIVEEGKQKSAGKSIYPLSKIKDIQAECEKTAQAIGSTSTVTKTPTSGIIYARYGML